MLHKRFSFRKSAKNLDTLASFTLFGSVFAVLYCKSNKDYGDVLFVATLIASAGAFLFERYRKAQKDPIFDAYCIYKISRMALIRILCQDIDITTHIITQTIAIFADYLVYYSLHSCANGQSFRSVSYASLIGNTNDAKAHNQGSIVFKLQTNKDVLITTLFAGMMHTTIQIFIYGSNRAIFPFLLFATFSVGSYNIASTITERVIDFIGKEYIEKIGKYLPDF